MASKKKGRKKAQQRRAHNKAQSEQRLAQSRNVQHKASLQEHGLDNPQDDNTQGKSKQPRAINGPAPQNPVNRQGMLDWRHTVLPRIGDSEVSAVPAATMEDQPYRLLAWSAIIISFFGILLTAQWSPLLLSLLCAATLIDPRVRKHAQTLRLAFVGALASLACWPFSSKVANGDSVIGLNQMWTTLGALFCFSLALWATGELTRRCSLLHERLQLRAGLYGLGMACQALCLLVVWVGTGGLVVYQIIGKH